ncbi:MAG: HlyD family efflux transporter periplasmic adaptor subunit [Candidatus Hydrogenedentes bacterium]|nr:HlyD family efflux transporter periplasmic adaptor subunit [Candidatus Hydrogenedentota bacterium]
MGPAGASSDIPRRGSGKKRVLRVFLYTALVVIAVAAITAGLSLWRAAAPPVDKNSLWFGEVQFGEFVRQVRGNGTLVPKEMWWVPAPVEGRVESIPVRPGQAVAEGEALIEMSNPVLERDVLDAEWKVDAAEAELRKQEAQLASDLVDQEDAIVTLSAQYEVSKLQADRDDQLQQQGLLSKIERDTSAAKARELATRLDLAQKRLTHRAALHDAQLAVQHATLQQMQGMLELRKKQQDDLHIRANHAGVVQQILVEEGQQLQASISVAKLARPDALKAELKIAETQAKDILDGQPVSIDTRNGLIAGRVSRIDPAVLEGTVTVEVELVDELPRGARPDLAVEGVIELERVQDVLHVERPVEARSGLTVPLFKVNEAQNGAVRVPIEFGRASVNQIEILRGVEQGDRLILSDMTKYESHDRVALR